MSHATSLAVRRDTRKLCAPLVLHLLLGCGHAEPFGSAPTGHEGPFDATPPVRLTLNRGPDRGAAWLPDGSGLLYSAQQPGRRDHDVCLALLPPAGGSQRRLTCDLTPTGGDSTDAAESPAPSPDGRLAYVAVSSRIDNVTPGSAAIALASIADPIARTPLQALPYTIPGERLHSNAAHLRWLGPTRLVYVGERVEYRRSCPGCTEWDTLRSGLDVTLLDVNQPGEPPMRVPGTDMASGVSVGSSEDEIYYTINGDSRVYHRVLSTGAVNIVHDFGAAGIARDVHVAANRLAAVVGGRVSFGSDPTLGVMQWDSGGTLHLVDLQTGTGLILEGPGLFRRPQVSPSGTAIVAEVYPIVVTGPPESDTTVSGLSDLLLFGQP